MKVATAEYTHSALVLVKPNAGATVKVGDKTPTQIKIAKTPTTAKPEALYAADTDKATDALLISDIKAKTLHIFSGKLDTAGAKAKSFTIPEKEIPQAEAEKLKGKTFDDLTKTPSATDFKWIK